MAERCSECPQLRSQVQQLRVLVQQLHARLAVVGSQAEGVARLIDDEQEQPKLPRGRLLPTIRARIMMAADTAKGN